MKWPIPFPIPKLDLKDVLLEKRPLPVGVPEFHEWSARIISGAMLPATDDSQKFTLANILINLGPTVAFESDAYFINCLRKSAANQVADEMRRQIREAAKARLAIEEAKQKEAEATAPIGADAKVLENPNLSGAQ